MVLGIAVNAAAADCGGAGVAFPALVDAFSVRPDAVLGSPVAAAAVSCVVAEIVFPVLVKARCSRAWGTTVEAVVKRLHLGYDYHASSARPMS